MSKEDIQADIKLLEKIFKTYGLPKNYNIDGYILEDRLTISKLLKAYKTPKIVVLATYSCFCKDRAYYALEDSLTRECIDKNITDIAEAQKALKELIEKHNYRSINTISQEPPYLRFKNGNKVRQKD